MSLFEHVAGSAIVDNRGRFHCPYCKENTFIAKDTDEFYNHVLSCHLRKNSPKLGNKFLPMNKERFEELLREEGAARRWERPLAKTYLEAMNIKDRGPSDSSEGSCRICSYFIIDRDIEVVRSKMLGHVKLEHDHWLEEQQATPDTRQPESKYGAGRPRLDLLPLDGLELAAGAFERGLAKYKINDWRESDVSHRDRLRAAISHCFHELEGRTEDETGASHLGNAIADLLMVATLRKMNKGKKDI